MRPSLRILSAVALSVLAAMTALLEACGGASRAPAQNSRAEPREPASAADDAPKATGRTPKRAAARCDDGSCFSCGEAVCLSGYYCAVGRAGHGCAWAPSCATHPTCTCLNEMIRENPTCRCEEHDNGVYVACDGASL